MIHSSTDPERAAKPRRYTAPDSPRHARRHAPRRRLRIAVAFILGPLVVLTSGFFALSAQAATPSVLLGTAGTYSVLGGEAVSSTGNSILTGDLGVSPGSAITGFPPGVVYGDTRVGAAANGAKDDLVTAYNDAAGRDPIILSAAELGGQTLVDGVYSASGAALSVNGTLTLDGRSDPTSTFIFQTNSTLITGSYSHVVLINGADACNVFWQVGSSATLGTISTFAGTILALTSITVADGAVVDGRALARNGAVTLDDATFLDPRCASGSTATVTAPAVTTTVTAPAVTTTVTAPAVTATVTAPAVTETTTVTAPAVTETATVTAPAVTTTVTAPAVTETATVTAPAVTQTVTAPAVTQTVTAPAVTETVTLPAVTQTVTVAAVTETVTAPAVTETVTVAAVTETVTLPGTTSTVTDTVTAPAVTQTVTLPAVTQTVTDTVTAPAVTETVTVAAVTETVTLPGTTSTVTDTVTAPAVTETVTVAAVTETVTVAAETMTLPAETVTLPAETMTMTETETLGAATVTETETETLGAETMTETETETLGAVTVTETATVTETQTDVGSAAAVTVTTTVAGSGGESRSGGGITIDSGGGAAGDLTPALLAGVVGVLGLLAGLIVFLRRRRHS